MRLKEVKWIYNEENEKRLKTFKDKINFFKHESCADYIKLQVFGMHLGKGYIPQHIYDLILFRDQNAMDEYNHTATRTAKQIINANLVKKGFPKEPYEELPDNFRDDMFIFNDFKPFTDYKGHWIDIDMNSAEPYFVSKFAPTLAQSIAVRYGLRKKFPSNKKVLNCINGNLRNSHVSIYKKVCNTLKETMLDLAEELRRFGFIPFALRRDGLIVSAPDSTTPLPIKEGTKMGEWKVVRDYGTIRTGSSEVFFQTDMEKITTKSPKRRPSLLDNVTIVCNIYLLKGVEINEKRNVISVKEKDIT